MFRAPQMQNSILQVRFHPWFLLALRDAVHEQTFSLFKGSCMQGDGMHWLRRLKDACAKTLVSSIHNCSSVFSRFSVDTSKCAFPQKTTLPCLLTQVLLIDRHHSYVNKENSNNAFLLWHSCLLAPPSANVRRKYLLPGSSDKKQTHCYVFKHKRENTGNILSFSNTGTVLSMGHFGRTAQPAVQTCGLHTNTQQQVLLDKCLSAGNEARCRQFLLPNTALYERQEKSWAAVLVCLCIVSGQPAFLFTLRSAKLKGRHKGDVSFAGGKKDCSDRTVIDTALREACEELGIHITEEKVWGVLKPLRDQNGMMIAPVIANLGPLEVLSFHPNPSEVEEIFTLTLEHLCLPQNQGYTHFRTGDRYSYTLPVFHSPKYRIWGLTAMALNHTLKLIVPPQQLLSHSLVQ